MFVSRQRQRRGSNRGQALGSCLAQSPIHQGDAVATDNGRAEVEFESGNIAFLAQNTVLEFYDLSSRTAPLPRA